MSYREVPEALPTSDASTKHATSLLDGEEMTPKTVTATGGTWTHEADAGQVRVTIKWNDDIFTHASAAVGPEEEKLTLDLAPSARGTDSACDPASGTNSAPVFVPTDSRYEFAVELVGDEARTGENERR